MQRSRFVIFLILFFVLIVILFDTNLLQQNYDYYITAAQQPFNNEIQTSVSEDVVIQYTDTINDDTLFTDSINITVIDDVNDDITNVDDDEILFDYCNLRDLDPWDPTILEYLKPTQNLMKNCKPKVPKITKLENGLIFVNPPSNLNISCQWRCLYPKTDLAIKYGNWSTVDNGTSAPPCDIIEIKCLKQENGRSANFYKYLHHQIFRADPPSDAETPSTQNLEKPDVFVIVIDSVSESQLIRSMPKTVHTLREYYEAISFRHLNKIGINSRPNGFAMVVGKTINSISKSPMSRGHEADYKNYHAYCSKYMDGDQFIGFRYQDDGYVTMMAEDWAAGLFNWQNCIGFKSKPTDHYMRPFQLRYEPSSSIKAKDMDEIMNKGSCKESFNHQMEYLQNFINAYPDKPKFSLTWMINLAHNDYNALYHTDDYFYQFFKNNQEKLNNSYIFFMADHGPRFGGLRKTDIGEIEDNNPFLFLSLPAKLRRNTNLTETLKINSKMLITQYDIYATLTEIAKPQNPRHPKPLIKGSSIFHPLPQPRTCDKLLIPFQYCICKPERKILPKNNSIAIPAAKKMVAQMNFNLRESKDTREKCATLKLDTNSSIKVEEFIDESSLKVYQITYSTQPGGGQFWGYVSKRENEETITVLSEWFPRLNLYAPQVKCAAKANYAPYCFCKNLLPH